MTTSHDIQTTIAPEDLADLLDEIRRYLAAIEMFRHEGCEPSWRFESRVEVLR